MKHFYYLDLVGYDRLDGTMYEFVSEFYGDDAELLAEIKGFIKDGCMLSNIRKIN